MRLTPETMVLQGGLDLVTPGRLVRPGYCVGGENYLADAEGYRRIDGYERLDGRPKPSEATYDILSFSAGSAEPSVGATVTGGTSGATGTLLVAAVVESGSWGGGDAAGYLVLGEVSGTFQVAESVTFATTTSVNLPFDAPTIDLGKAYLTAAQEARRTAISAPPGSGPLRGAATLNGTVYAWRDNAGGTAGVMWRATAAGWVEVNLSTVGEVLNFDAGDVRFSEGETVTGGTSGATATVQRVVTRSGAYDPGNDAAGFLVVTGRSGTFQNNEAITGSSGGVATVNGAIVAQTLPAGGFYRWREHNFYGAAGTRRLYVANGVGRAFEWDGTVMAPIYTGLADAVDKPSFVEIFAEHIFLAVGSELTYGGPGDPLQITGIAGGGSLAVGSGLRGIGVTSTAMIVLAEQSVRYLSGTDNASFVLKTVSDESGAVERSFAIADRPYYLDQVGIRELAAAEVFGDWRMGSISQMIQPLIDAKRDSGLTPVGAVVVQRRDQYRLFWSDGSGIAIYLGRQTPEAMPFRLGFAPVFVVRGENAAGDEMILAGDAQGMLYELQSGTSFDGAPVLAFLRPVFENARRPNLMKRWFSAITDVVSPDTISIGVMADYDYGDPNVPATPEAATTLPGAGGIWDISSWDEFVWDSPLQGAITADLNGWGSNVSVGYVTEHTVERPHVLTTRILNWAPRRMMR